MGAHRGRRHRHRPDPHLQASVRIQGNDRAGREDAREDRRQVAEAGRYAIDPNADSPLKVLKSDLKIESSEGSLLLDTAAGSVVESKSVTRIKGDILFTANGTELPSKLDLTLDTSTARASRRNDGSASARDAAGRGEKTRAIPLAWRSSGSPADPSPPSPRPAPG